MLCLEINIDSALKSIIFKTKDGAQVISLYYVILNQYTKQFKFLENYSIPQLEIIRLYVDPSYRHLGYATLALQKLIEINEHIKTMFVIANPDEPERITLSKLEKIYGKVGFRHLIDLDEGSLLLRIS